MDDAPTFESEDNVDDEEDEKDSDEENTSGDSAKKPKSDADGEKTNKSEKVSSEHDDAISSAEKHRERVTTWGRSALRNWARIGSLIPDNKEAEKQLVLAMASTLAPVIRSMKKNELRWDQENSRDIGTITGMQCVRMLLEYTLVGITQGLKLNKKELDKEVSKVKDSSEEAAEARKREEDAERSRKDQGRGKLRTEASLLRAYHAFVRLAKGTQEHEEVTEQRDTSGKHGLAGEYRNRQRKISLLVKGLLKSYLILLRESLNMIPDGAEIALKPKGFKKIFQRKKDVKTMPVVPMLKKLGVGSAKMDKTFMEVIRHPDVVKKINNRYLIVLYTPIMFFFKHTTLMVKKMVR